MRNRDSGEGGGARSALRQRLPWEAATFAALVPGLGHFLCGRALRGSAWCAALVGGFAGVLYLFGSPAAPGVLPALVGAIILAGLWAAMLWDAHRLCAAPAAPRQANRNRLWRAAFLTALLAWLGHFATKRPGRGAGFLLLALLLFASDPLLEALGFPGGYGLDAITSAAGALVAIWAMLDLFRTASSEVSPGSLARRRLIGAVVAGVFLGYALGIVPELLFETRTVPANHMRPYFSQGDRTLIFKAAYWTRPVARDDIVAFRVWMPGDSDAGRLWMGRVWAVPGDSVNTAKHRITGTEFTTPPDQDTGDIPRWKRVLGLQPVAGRPAQSVLADGFYLVSFPSDPRGEPMDDACVIGPVPESSIIGEVTKTLRRAREK